MNVAVLCRRLSDNTFVRSYLLLQTLPDDVSVDVYGLVDSRGVHDYFDTDEFDFHTVRTGDYGDWDGDPTVRERVGSLSVQIRHAVRLWSLFRGEAEETDVVFVASGWKGSVGAGLLAKFVSPRSAPVLVDVFDRTEWVEQFPFGNPLDWVDAVVASNRPLAAQLDGEVLYTPVDTDRFDPAAYDSAAVREELGVADDEFLAGFIGTPRWNKGTDILVDAVSGMDGVRAAVVGMTEGEYGAQLEDDAPADTIFVPPVSHADVPRYYAALDALVLPHRDHANSEFQIPAKLFEAMSMGTPVIASNVGDISHVLGDTGVILDEPSAEEVRAAIETVGAAGSADIGERARARAVAEFSAASIGEEFRRMLDDLVADGVESEKD